MKKIMLLSGAILGSIISFENAFSMSDIVDGMKFSEIKGATFNDLLEYAAIKGTDLQSIANTLIQYKDVCAIDDEAFEKAIKHIVPNKDNQNHILGLLYPANTSPYMQQQSYGGGGMPRMFPFPTDYPLEGSMSMNNPAPYGQQPGSIGSSYSSSQPFSPSSSSPSTGNGSNRRVLPTFPPTFDYAPNVSASPLHHQREVSQLQEENRRLKEENAVRKAEVDSLRNQLGALRVEKQRINVETDHSLLQKSAEVERLDEKIRSLTTENKLLRKKDERHYAEFEQYNQSKKTLATRAETAEKNLIEAQKELRKVKEKLKSLEEGKNQPAMLPYFPSYPSSYPSSYNFSTTSQPDNNASSNNLSVGFLEKGGSSDMFSFHQTSSSSSSPSSSSSSSPSSSSSSLFSSSLPSSSETYSPIIGFFSTSSSSNSNVDNGTLINYSSNIGNNTPENNNSFDHSGSDSSPLRSSSDSHLPTSSDNSNMSNDGANPNNGGLHSTTIISDLSGRNNSSSPLSSRSTSPDSPHSSPTGGAINSFFDF